MQTLEEVETTRYDNLPKVQKVVVFILFCIGIGAAVFYVFDFTINGVPLQQYAYYYLLVALFAGSAFLILPARKKDKRPSWYDLIAAIFVFGTCVYFSTNSTAITWGKWAIPSTLNFVLAFILALLVLEAARRVAGPIFMTVCIIFGSYPLFAEYMPGILWGRGFNLVETIGSLGFSPLGLVGIPTSVMAEILIGFLLFAGFLLASGAGTFFLNLALCILGRFRGGPAKVAVVASGFFGSLSGGIVSNIVATGSFTIPTMKRMGYPAHYAGAIETCASMGGVLMPPVMGAVAFVMVQFLSIEYAVVIVAAAIPALLYYFGLLMQVDAYAGKVGLKGLSREEIPSLKKTLAEGWPFIAVLVFLLWGLLYMRWEELTPFYATGLLFLLSFFRKETMITPRRLIATLATTGKLITQTFAMILPIGFIINGLVVTGMSGAFAAGLVQLGGENLFLVLIMGVVAIYIMGMAGLVVCAYIFLAITLAPALIEIANLNTLAVHLFLLYYANLGMITPPVAVASFVGAAIAKAPPMKTAIQAMRMAVVIYFVPFFFLFNPALILQGSLVESLYLFVLCLLGIILIAGGIEGYLLKVGRLSFWARIPLAIAGFLIGLPEWITTIIGAVLAAVIIAALLIRKRQEGLPTSQNPTVA